MPKFEVGDKVRVNDPGSCFHGRDGKISKVNEPTSSYNVRFKDFGGDYTFLPSELEPAPKSKKDKKIEDAEKAIERLSRELDEYRKAVEELTKMRANDQAEFYRRVNEVRVYHEKHLEESNQQVRRLGVDLYKARLINKHAPNTSKLRADNNKLRQQKQKWKRIALKSQEQKSRAETGVRVFRNNAVFNMFPEARWFLMEDDTVLFTSHGASGAEAHLYVGTQVPETAVDVSEEEQYETEDDWKTVRRIV